MKRKHVIDFLTIVLFFGVLLSLTVYVGIGAFIDSRGEHEKNESELFADSFYTDENLNYFIRYIDYKFFRHTGTENILIGNDDWIFETIRAENGYNYLLDHIGEASFSQDELVRIKTNLEREKAYYQGRGVDYMVVIIPNSMSVCEDKIPAFLGARSENARLSTLSGYLSGEIAYIDPTERLKADCSIETPYNNTENSINAYGAYSIYSTVMERINDIRGESLECLRYEDITFSVRMTDGKTAATSAGLEKIVQNRTVSLTDEMTGSYDITDRSWNCFTTVKKNTELGSPTLLLKLSNEWDRIQLMPFFSNTFDKVFYENGDIDLVFVTEKHCPDIVVRMIRESELEELLR